MTEFTPLHHGWRVNPRALRHGPRRRKDGPKPGRTRRQVSLMWDVSGGDFVYVAVSECGRAAKIGKSWNPVIRVYEGLKRDVAVLGVGKLMLIRMFRATSRRSAYRLERACHRFLAVDRLSPDSREWFVLGPRFRVLLSRLDRRFAHRSAA